jgi:formylglycine-generating enzyme
MSGQAKGNIYTNIEIYDGVAIDFVHVKPGKFLMGGDDEEAYENEKKIRLTTITKDYYLSKTPITQAQWQAVMGNNPSRFIGKDLPVEKVSWLDIMTGGQDGGNEKSFISQLKISPISGLQFTLPTEAQWEYAAKGGHCTALNDDEFALWKAKKLKASDKYLLYSGGERIKEVGWHGDRTYDFEAKKVVQTGVFNALERTQPAGLKAPNQLGLYDMSGNVWEWCRDWYQDEYDLKDYKDPECLVEDTFRVIRGGSWNNEPRYCRVSFRSGGGPDYQWNNTGFRLALSSQV